MCKKNSEANNRAYDLNQKKTMAALDRLAEVFKTFEDTWAFVEKESAEGDLLLADRQTLLQRKRVTRVSI